MRQHLVILYNVFPSSTLVYPIDKEPAVPCPLLCAVHDRESNNSMSLLLSQSSSISLGQVWLEERTEKDLFLAGGLYCGELQLLPFRWLATELEGKNWCLYTEVCVFYLNHLSSSQNAGFAPYFKQMLRRWRKPWESRNQNNYLNSCMFTKCLCNILQCVSLGWNSCVKTQYITPPIHI